MSGILQWMGINITNLCEPESNFGTVDDQAHVNVDPQTPLFPLCELLNMAGPCETWLCKPKDELVDVCANLMGLSSSNEHILHRLIRLSDHSVQLLKVCKTCRVTAL